VSPVVVADDEQSRKPGYLRPERQRQPGDLVSAGKLTLEQALRIAGGFRLAADGA